MTEGINNMFSYKICRLCIHVAPVTFSLLTNNAHKMLEALTSIEVKPDDEIVSVCLKCSLNLKLAYKIQQNILKADKNLKNKLYTSIEQSGTNIIKTEQIIIPEDEVIKSEPESISISKKIKKKSGSSESPYTCKTCSKEFPTKRQYWAHSHARKECPICKKEITSYNFSNHLNNHQMGPQVCEHCGKTFAGVQSLQDHVRNKHSGISYECIECNKTFKNRQGLYAHKKREHMDTAGCICDTCGRKFTFNYDLKKHVQLTHLKKRPYICEFCNRGFSRLYAMKTHRRQHTNETPYKCDICGEGFRQNVSLKTHKKSKHDVIEATTCKCNVCGKDFASMHAVKSHMRCH